MKAWKEENKRIETMFWEDVASGKIPVGTLSPAHVYEMSLIEADQNPAPGEQASPIQSTDNIDVVSKVKQLKELLDAGLIERDEFDSKKKELLSKL